VVEALSLLVAVGAAVLAYLSWRAARRANKISGRALQLTALEHSTRAREREARARIELTVLPGANHEFDPHGVIWSQGSTIVTTLELTIVNRGDRAAGRTSIDVWVPRFTSDPFWADGAGGREVAGVPRSTPDPKVRLNDGIGAHTYESARLTRVLDGVPVDQPERLYVRATFPTQDDEAAYPVDVIVRAEHAEDETSARKVVRIRRR
jgi:hypothetical protein